RRRNPLTRTDANMHRALRGLTKSADGSVAERISRKSSASGSSLYLTWSGLLMEVLHDSELRAVSGGNALLTVREVAAILRVCRDTVYRLCANGQLPHVRILNAIRITPADLDAFLSIHRDCPRSVLRTSRAGRVKLPDRSSALWGLISARCRRRM